MTGDDRDGIAAPIGCHGGETRGSRAAGVGGGRDLGFDPLAMANGRVPLPYVSPDSKMRHADAPGGSARLAIGCWRRTAVGGGDHALGWGLGAP
jgi:hypothetical protein